MKAHIGKIEIKISPFMIAVLVVINAPRVWLGKKPIQPRWAYKVVGPRSAE